MKCPYVVDRAKVPQVSLGGGTLRPHPVLAVRLFGPGGSYLVDGYLDTGADDTVFPLWITALVGLDLGQAQEQDIHLAGRRQPIRARFLSVELRITDGVETFHWSAPVGFVAIPLRRALLGHAGFLQFFNAEFRGADLEVNLTPNHSFTGRRI